MSIISTEQAIQIGIESIRLREDIPPKTKEQALRLLGKLEQADWYRNWTKESIIEALNDYKERTGKAPTVTNLKERGMPNSVTVRSVFHMSPSLVLKRLFPENRRINGADSEILNSFGFETEDDWLNCFVEQFNKHREEGMCCKTYNALRDNGTPAWNTIAHHCKITSWSELMKKTGVEYIKNKRETAHDIYISNATSPLVDKLEALMKERRKLNQELIDLWDRKGLL